MYALEGIRVLDFTHYIAGPFCSQILADHGADVIRIEPIGGEPARLAKPKLDETSLYFMAQNRNKRAMGLNLKTPESALILKKLVESVDLIVTNYSADVPKRLGIDYETLAQINSRIIMVHITGFGITGPYRDRIAYDGIIQSMSGLADLTGDPEGMPNHVGFYIADHIAGIQGAMGAILALSARERTGVGQLVDISMLDSMLAMMSYHFSEVLQLGNTVSRIGNRLQYTYSKMFKTKDGYVYIAPVTLQMWKSFVKELGLEDWAADDSPYVTQEGRMRDEALLDKAITSWTIEQTKRQIFQRLQQLGIPCGPVNTLSDVLQDPHIKERKMLQSCGGLIVPGVPVKLSKTPAKSANRPPRIGEHTQEILQGLGFSQDQITAFIHSGTVEVEK